jgi:CO dehydrogenase nickel-insertion accessory protein CooC1
VRVFREARIRSVMAVLNRVATPAVEAYLRTALDGSGAPAVAVFREERAVAEQWLRGERLRSRHLADAGSALAREIEARAQQADAPAPDHQSAAPVR